MYYCDIQLGSKIKYIDGPSGSQDKTSHAYVSKCPAFFANRIKGDVKCFRWNAAGSCMQFSAMNVHWTILVL